MMKTATAIAVAHGPSLGTRQDLEIRRVSKSRPLAKYNCLRSSPALS